MRRRMPRSSSIPTRRSSLPRKTLAATLSSGIRLSSWWMTTTLAPSASPGLLKSTTSPSRWISPSSGWWTPAMIFVSVDLPAPFSPTSPWTSPARKASETSASAWTGPKRLLTPCTDTTGAAAPVAS